MENELDNKIIETLKDGEKSSTEIASIINRSYYDALKILESLCEQKKVEKIEMGKYTFWKIKYSDMENEI